MLSLYHINENVKSRNFITLQIFQFFDIQEFFI